ncbi:hypothetical protein E2562_029039 [Oryza meyeriana var. granulata]|uniref:Uncharacterized protein n=1 Tax=Oryza meyeriana var. granulata TaxID=110450 RepID=A0A6G1E2F1_9ORYZ|nr:hypothetical protein E2562_029039 [Oryza meyeriana var. granulata]
MAAGQPAPAGRTAYAFTRVALVPSDDAPAMIATAAQVVACHRHATQVVPCPAEPRRYELSASCSPGWLQPQYLLVLSPFWVLSFDPATATAQHGTAPALQRRDARLF